MSFIERHPLRSFLFFLNSTDGSRKAFWKSFSETSELSRDSI